MRIYAQPILKMIGPEALDQDFVQRAEAVRLNNSSTQVYMAMKEGETIDESSGDLFFTSTAKEFRTDLLLSRDITSRTFSFYYPHGRPDKPKERYAIVSSTNANWSDWADLNEEDYEASKADLVETTIDGFGKIHSRRRDKRSIAPKLPRRALSIITLRHEMGASFGTKFEGLGVSRELPKQDRRHVSRRQCRYHHERLAGSDQLWRDRQQRSRHSWMGSQRRSSG